LDCNDIAVPVKEVKDYLTAKYDARFFIHPRKFEEVVDSVFRSMGYNSFITAYSNDGGIDIVLNETDSTVGVQVKRYKDKIKVEQIRAFAGALLLKGCSKGLYVTTSDFQPGAYKAAEQFTSRTLPNELINADRFYDALKIVRRKEFDLTQLYNLLEKRRIYSIYFYFLETPRNIF
jgi:restriction system protein